MKTDAQPFSKCNHQFERGCPPQEYEQHGAWRSARGAGIPLARGAREGGLVVTALALPLARGAREGGLDLTGD